MDALHVGTDDTSPAYWMFGTLLIVKASGTDTGGRYCLVEQTGPRGVATPLHRQPADDEAFYVLEGELRFWDGSGHATLAGPGTLTHIAANKPHAFAVASDTARWLTLTTPNHEAFFYAVGEPAPRRELPPAGPPDLSKLEAAYDTYGVVILGPPPALPA